MSYIERLNGAKCKNCGALDETSLHGGHLNVPARPAGRSVAVVRWLPCGVLLPQISDLDVDVCVCGGNRTSFSSVRADAVYVDQCVAFNDCH